MRLAAIGVGGAGGRVLSALKQDSGDRQGSYLAGCCALDTDTAALDQLQAVPSKHCHAFGHGETAGTGTDGDRTTAIAAVEAERTAIRRAIDPLITSAVDAIVLIAGMAGGTGSGATPHIAQALAEIYDRPIYTVGVLPAEATQTTASNTLRALKALDSAVDAQFLFDTSQWLASGTPLEEDRDRLNTELATRLGALCAAGEAETAQTVGQSVVDASDIIATVSGPETGFVALGYATQELSPTETQPAESITARLRDALFGSEEPAVDEITALNAVETTARQAVRRRLTIDCERDSTSRGLLVFAGPPRWLHRDAIAKQRAWVQDELACPELRSGDTPTPETHEIATVVVMSGVDEIPRLSELSSLATDAPNDASGQ